MEKTTKDKVNWELIGRKLAIIESLIDNIFDEISTKTPRKLFNFDMATEPCHDDIFKVVSKILDALAAAPHYMWSDIPLTIYNGKDHQKEFEHKDVLDIVRSLLPEKSCAYTKDDDDGLVITSII